MENIPENQKNNVKINKKVAAFDIVCITGFILSVSLMIFVLIKFLGTNSLRGMNLIFFIIPTVYAVLFLGMFAMKKIFLILYSIFTVGVIILSYVLVGLMAGGCCSSPDGSDSRELLKMIIIAVLLSLYLIISGVIIGRQFDLKKNNTNLIKK